MARKARQTIVPLVLALLVLSIADASTARQIRNRFAGFLHPFLHPRVPGTPGNKQVQTYLLDTFAALGWQTEVDRFTVPTTPRGPVEFANIIAIHNPSAPRRLVLAAHFDSKVLAGGDFIGATDSAVPCGMLVDIATTLDALLDKRERSGSGAGTTVEMIFFDGEEAFGEWSATDSLYGSRHLAEKWESEATPGQEITEAQKTEKNKANASVKASKRPKGRLASIDAFVLLDLLGYPTSKIVRMESRTSWMWERLVEIEGKLAENGLLVAKAKADALLQGGEPAYFVPGDNFMAQFIDDDHRPFKERNVPVVHLIPVPFPPVWHTLRDDAHAIDTATVQDLTRILRVMVAEYLGLL
ncbi:hypothetical protein DFJ73DRAFT_953939 [Zopfochytrium polystomum]|nr:hypothetical protein DFJ73DRAFT_953939 [Zopfochytrium polystomum]